MHNTVFCVGRAPGVCKMIYCGGLEISPKGRPLRKKNVKKSSKLEDF
jgi:hypothetical protein